MIAGFHDRATCYCLVWLARWRRKTAPRRAACLVRRPAMRLRHIRKDDGFMCRRIKSITADSVKPNWASIASKVVRSSQAISTIREMLDSQNASGASAERVGGDRIAAFGMSETGAESAVFLKTQRFGSVLTLTVQTYDIATQLKSTNALRVPSAMG